MAPEPYYTGDCTTPAYQLRYNWTGWPSEGQTLCEPDEPFFDELAQRWEGDGIRLLERRWSAKQVQTTASVKPSVAPQEFAKRMKGRLQHALRKADMNVKFSRKLAMRTVGETKTATVESYIENQVAKEPLADPRFAEFLEQFTVAGQNGDLTEPTRTHSGRYWYNLHLVLVIRDRSRISDEQSLSTLRDGTLRIAELKGHRISRLSVMPDHLHLALRGNIEMSPQDIALNFMNNLAHLMRISALWMPSYYVGSIGCYDMNAIRCGSVGSSPVARSV